ncbi:putative ATP-dependent helicase IRC3 [Batrachochytrium dendrobatidis]
MWSILRWSGRHQQLHNTSLQSIHLFKHTYNFHLNALSSFHFELKQALHSVTSSQHEHIELRPYQKECIHATLKMFEAGVQRTAVSLPVGSGKTVIFANLIPQLKSTLPSATKTLVLAHREELIDQAHAQVQRHCPHLKVSIDRGNIKPWMDADVIIASVQSIGRENGFRIKAYDPKLFKCIIIDEAHHASAPTYNRVLEYMGAFDPESHMRVWGCSGTLRRNDGQSLHPTFLSIAYAQPITTMITEGWLCDVDVKQVQTQIDIVGVRTNPTSGDYSLPLLSAAVNTPERNLTIAQLYLNEAASANCKSTLVFAVDIAHINDLVEAFQKKGIPAIGVHGNTPLHTRQKIIKEFSNGNIPVLINCGIVTEGVDIPRIDCVMLARPTKSSGLLQQMLGRGMRKFEGKKRCIVFDFVDTMNRSLQAATIPTLFGLSPMFNMQGKTIKEMSSIMERLESKHLDLDVLSQMSTFEELKEYDQIVGSQYDGVNHLGYSLKPFLDPFSLVIKEDEDQYLKKLSRFAWTRVATQKWVLSTNVGSSALILEKKDKIYICTYIQNKTDRRKNPRKKNIVVQSDTLMHAFKGSDTFITKTLGYTHSMQLGWNAPWRNSKATPKQIQFANQIGISKYVDLNGLSRGDLMVLLTRRQFGAIGAAKKAQVEDRRQNTMKNPTGSQHDPLLAVPVGAAL